MALLQQGVALHQQGRLAEAEALYRQALARAPGSFDALHLLGVVRHQKGQHAEALELIDAAIAANPNQAPAHSNRGNALVALRRPAEALASYDRALAIDPADAGALVNRGNVLLELDRYDEALASYDRALAAGPPDAVALANRASALLKLDRPAEALASSEAALRLRPDIAVAHDSRGCALLALKRPEDALACFDRALAASPEHAAILNNRGLALHELGRFTEALASLARAIALDPSYAPAHLNLAHCRLLLGDMPSAWRELEYRWQTPKYRAARREFAQPQWRGVEEIHGKTVLLHSEQGLGDTLQFCRYAEAVAGRGAKVVLEAPAVLRPVLASLAGVSVLASRGDVLPEFDLHCPLLSLPLALATRLASIPARVPYLSAPAEALGRWRERLAEIRQPRVGIAWAGNPAHGNDRCRSMPLATMAGLLSVPVGFVSLQRDLRHDDAVGLARYPQLAHFGEALADFGDTAALIDSLDLVIAVDTAVAHLAGAMGKPVWILLPYVPDWRWLLDRDDSPWYPTARLFRQSAAGDWGSVLRRVIDALEERFPAVR